jgi:GNAT superfamily N-acetyltransferase
LVAVADAALVGTVTATDKGGAVAYLGMLAVDPARQAGGLGRALMAAAEEEARGFGARAMEMTVIAPRGELIAYYERRGYARTGEIRPFPVSGFEHLQMVVLEKLL